MRLYRIDKEVDFPEKVSGKSDLRYANIRSAERIDVRPGETRQISTKLRVSFKQDKEKVFVVSYFNSTKYEIISSGEELLVPVENVGDRNIMIFPGTVIAEMRVEKRG